MLKKISGKSRNQWSAARHAPAWPFGAGDTTMLEDFSVLEGLRAGEEE